MAVPAPSYGGPHKVRELIQRRENAPSAPPDAMSTAVAKPVKVQDWESQKASTLDIEFVFASRVRGVASHDDGRGIHELLKSHSRRRTEAAAATRPLKRPVAVSATNEKMEKPNAHKTFVSSTKDLRILHSGLCRHRSSGRARTATTTRGILTFDFLLRFSRTAEARHRFRSLPGISS